MADTLTWLHLSDLHFGHGREARHRVDQQIVCDEILRDAGEVAAQLGPPDLIFITGDIAFKADPVQEYPHAAQWLDKLSVTVGVGQNQLYLAPGNHDVDRGQAITRFICRTVHDRLRSAPAALDELLAQPEELAPLWPKLQAYAAFAQPYAAPRLTPAHPFWHDERDTALGKVIIVGLNTVLLSFDNQDDPNNLALGQSQLQRAIQAQPRDALLLVLQHHPPAWLTDGAGLRAMLQDRAHLLFCGHVHHQGGLLSAPLSGGAWLELVAGAGHADPTQPAQHAYAWGRLTTAGLAYFPRTWNETQHRFVPDRNSFKGMRQDGAVFIPRRQLPAPLRQWLAGGGQAAGQPARGKRSSRRSSRPPATAAKPDLGPATAQYLSYLQDRHQYLSLKGIGLAERAPLKLPLLDLYVPLQARLELPPGETWNRPSLRLAGRALSPEEQEALTGRLSEPRPVLELLQQRDGLVILGDPGAGKTTFLKYLVLQQTSGAGAALGLGERLPVLAPLSGYAHALEQGDIRLDDFIADHFHDLGADFPLKALLADALARGTALVLLDGLDEVQHERLRHLVVERVVDFFTLHRKAGNKFVLTSRIIGYREVRRVAPGLAEGTLVDFNDEEIERFVDHWTRTLEKQAQGDTRLAQADAERERRELLAAVKRNAGVRQLAANPLLLTILALMKRQGITLPERRVELYDQYVKTLLSTWNRARGLGRPPARDLDPVQTVKILAPLALWMHETSPGVGLVKREALRRELEALSARRGKANPEACARQFLNDVHDYAGLLLERGPGEYGFIHLTFEEYLAAVAIALLGQGQAEIIAAALAVHVGEPAWHEVGLLTVGYVGLIQQLDTVAGSVVETLVQAQPGPAGAAVVLAGEATVDAGTVGIPSASRECVRAALLETMRQDSTVPAPTRSRAGRALAVLGDPRPGVGLGADGLPDLLWVRIPGPAAVRESGRFPGFAGLTLGEDARGPDLADFALAVYPVTVAQFRPFVEQGGYREKRYWSKTGWQRREQALRESPRYWEDAVWTPANHPVIGMSWYEAEAYCHWLNERGGLPAGTIRLPTEAEWEWAARGPERREYPWGNQWEDWRCNSDESGIGRTSAVGCFPGGAADWWRALPPDGEAVHDLAGNVWEWTASVHTEDYGGADQSVLNADADSSPRVLRGGSWASTPGGCAGRRAPGSPRGAGSRSGVFVWPGLFPFNLMLFPFSFFFPISPFTLFPIFPMFPFFPFPPPPPAPENFPILGPLW